MVTMTITTITTGMMVQPFNDAVFDKAKLNEVYGPVKVRSRARRWVEQANGLTPSRRRSSGTTSSSSRSAAEERRRLCTVHAGGKDRRCLGTRWGSPSLGLITVTGHGPVSCVAVPAPHGVSRAWRRLPHLIYHHAAWW